ncbi:MAG: hypothetical protein RLY71_1775 [Pseudomonadota bacterium]|jgi:hypothetical protein
MPARLITSFKRHSEANLQVRVRGLIGQSLGPWCVVVL